MRMAEASFRGRVRALTIADVMSFLGGLNRKGLLTVATEAVVVDLFLDAGRVIYATSTREGDRLSELLLSWGLIGRTQYENAMNRVAAGARLPSALTESGAMTSRDLRGARDRQVRRIVLSLFEWSDGEFHFLEGEDHQGELPAVDLPIPELVTDGIRSLQNLSLVKERLPSPDWVYEVIPVVQKAGSPAQLQPQEEYVLGLVDGSRTIAKIVELSGFPDLEVRRMLFLLFTLGRLKPKMQAAVEPGVSTQIEPIAEVVRRFNDMLGHVYRYLMREVGPISEHLLARSLREMRGAHPVLFSRSSLGGDGTLDGMVLQEKLRGLRDGRRHEILVQGLNELLYTEMLTLRRTLGTEHEQRVLQALNLDRDRTDPSTGSLT